MVSNARIALLTSIRATVRLAGFVWKRSHRAGEQPATCARVAGTPSPSTLPRTGRGFSKVYPRSTPARTILRGPGTTMVPEIISRKEARARGLDRYFTGKPCLRGHIAERPTSVAVCLECRKLEGRGIKQVGEEVHCVSCGGPFKIMRTCSTKQIYCSPRCRRLAQYARQRRGLVEKSCVICSAPILTHMTWKITCSKECADEKNRANMCSRPLAKRIADNKKISLYQKKARAALRALKDLGIDI
jgi:predicted nucleic acid-binding Zn ribbon protein